MIGEIVWQYHSSSTEFTMKLPLRRQKYKKVGTTLPTPHLRNTTDSRQNQTKSSVFVFPFRHSFSLCPFRHKWALCVPSLCVFVFVCYKTSELQTLKFLKSQIKHIACPDFQWLLHSGPTYYPEILSFFTVKICSFFLMYQLITLVKFSFDLECYWNWGIKPMKWKCGN